MLSPVEVNALRQKVIEYRPLFESNRGEGCVLNALQLSESYSGGLIAWIDDLSKIDLDVFICHAYFFPPDSDDNTIALNLTERGYPQYPPLTKREAIAIGTILDPDTIKQHIIRSISHL